MHMRAAIFDLGKVLLDFDHSLAARRILPYAGKTPEEIYRLFFDSGITGLFEEGKLSPQEFFKEVKNMLDLKMEFEVFLPAWNDIFCYSAQNREVYEIARTLKKEYPIVVLTNINVLHLAYIKEHFSFFDIFNEVIASCEVGARKPNRIMYDKALEALGFPADSVFYTDDRQDLITEAQNFGLQSFVFEGVSKLRADLIFAGARMAV